MKPKYIIRNCNTHGPNSTLKLMNKGRGILGYKCIKCCTNDSLRYKRKLKQKCVDFKGGECEKCGYNKSLAALDFHHLDPNEKDFNFSKKAAKWETLEKELNKCILVCANCHREIHEEISIAGREVATGQSHKLHYTQFDSVTRNQIKYE